MNLSCATSREHFQADSVFPLADLANDRQKLSVGLFNQQMKKTRWGVLPYALQSCESWSHAMGVLCRYLPSFLPHQHFSISWHHVSGKLIAEIHEESDEREKAVFAWLLHQLRWVGRHLLGTRFDVHSVTMPSFGEHEERRIRRLLGSVYVGRGSRFEITFLSPVLSEAPFLANGELLKYFQGKLDCLKLESGEQSYFEKTLAVFEASAQPKELDMERVSEQLSMSSRSLRRKLLIENLSFSDVQREAMVKIAAEFLDNPALTVEQVGERLGYRDIRSFYRAFKGWCGKTPSEYRASRAAGD